MGMIIRGNISFPPSQHCFRAAKTYHYPSYLWSLTPLRATVAVSELASVSMLITSIIGLGCW